MLFEILRRLIEDAENIEEHKSRRAHYKEKRQSKNYGEDYDQEIRAYHFDTGAFL